MGLWGAAQALAFGIGGLVGTAASDLSRMLIGSTGAAYAAVFALEALMFCVSAWLAARIGSAQRPATTGMTALPGQAPTIREPLQRGMT